MTTQNSKSLYIISGPCGVGKSTITKAFANQMERVVLIEGDLIQYMFKGKELLPWDERISMAWKNIVSITKNFIENNLDIIIDYVVETELDWFCEQLSEFELDIYYIVLRADKDILINRLIKRGENEKLINRSLFLLDELENNLSNKQYLYDTTNKQPNEIIKDISTNIEQFRV